jgi:hypothetical protein
MSNHLLEISIFFLIISFLSAHVYKALVKSVIQIPIYIDPLKREIKDSSATIVKLFNFMMRLSLIISTFSFCFFLSSGWSFIIPGIVVWLSDKYYSNYIAQYLPTREVACASCKKSLKQYLIEIDDLLTDIEMANNRAGTTECIANIALCSDCSFPLTRETIGLKIKPFKTVAYRSHDEYLNECPHCRYYFQPSLIYKNRLAICFMHPVRAGQSDKPVSVICSRQCEHCGYYSQSFPQFTLSSIEYEIREHLFGPETKKYYGTAKEEISRKYDYQKAKLIIQEIEDMLECDSQGTNYLLKSYDIVDSFNQLKRIKFLSEYDKKKTIKLLSTWKDSVHIVTDASYYPD